MNNTNKGLDFTTLNEIEEDIKIAQDTLKNVLTTSQKKCYSIFNGKQRQQDT